MIIIAESNEGVGTALIAGFGREGIAATCMNFDEAEGWFVTASSLDMNAVEALLVGGGGDVTALARSVRATSRLPIIAIRDKKALSETLDILNAGADDVVAKPVHIKELIARIRAATRRLRKDEPQLQIDGLYVQTGNHDPIVNGTPLLLPRRERRVLECLVEARGGWVTKNQVFNRVYGIFNDGIDENVVESHVSRLRKRLRDRLGREIIQAQRYMGYRLVCKPLGISMIASSEQAAPDNIDHRFAGIYEDKNERIWADGHERVRDGSAG